MATLEGNADARDIPVVAASLEGPRQPPTAGRASAATGAARSC